MHHFFSWLLIYIAFSQKKPSKPDFFCSPRDTLRVLNIFGFLPAGRQALCTSQGIKYLVVHFVPLWASNIFGFTSYPCGHQISSASLRRFAPCSARIQFDRPVASQFITIIEGGFECLSLRHDPYLKHTVFTCRTNELKRPQFFQLLNSGLD